MEKKKKIIKKQSKSASSDRTIELLERFGVGLLYASTDLGQNNIAKIMGMSDGRVNKILKGIKKPNKSK